MTPANNPTPALGGPNVGSSSNWRTRLTPKIRCHILNKIVEMLKKSVPSSQPYDLSELEKISMNFEKRVYESATSEEDYLRRIKFKMLSIRLLPTSIAANSMPSSSTCTDPTSISKEGQLVDWKEEAYQKVNCMKAMYLPELLALSQKFDTEIRLHHSLPQQKTECFEELKAFKRILDNIIAKLCMSKDKFFFHNKEEISIWESAVIDLITKARNRNPVSSLRLKQLALVGMHSLQYSLPSESQTCRMLPLDNKMTIGSIAMREEDLTSLQQDPLTIKSNFRIAQQDTMNAKQDKNMLLEQEQVVTASHKFAAGSMLIPKHVLQHSKDNNLSLGGTSIQQPAKSSMNVQKHQKTEVGKTQQGLQESQRHMLQRRRWQQMLPAEQFHACDLPRHQFSDGSEGLQLMDNNQEGKTRVSNSNISSQLFQDAVPRVLKYNSVKIDHNNMQNSFTSNCLSRSTKLSAVIHPKSISGCFDTLSECAGNTECQQTGFPTQTEPKVISTPDLSASPLLAKSAGACGNPANESGNISCQSSLAELPLQRLVKSVDSASHQALTASVTDIMSVVSVIEMQSSSENVSESRASVVDLAANIKSHFQARYFFKKYGTTQSRFMCHCISAPSGSILFASDSDSTTMSRTKRRRTEANHAFFEEITKVNQLLIGTVVNVSDEHVGATGATSANEGGEGIIVKCSFNAEALSPNAKRPYASIVESSILPLRLLIPANYPNRSPELIESPPQEFNNAEDLSIKATLKLRRSLRTLAEPFSLKDIAINWDACARSVITENAEKFGGGSFSSTYGTWENCCDATHSIIKI